MADDDSAPPIISCKEARLRGLQFYFTGKPCKRGHVSLRRVKSTSCCQCDYGRTKKWREENHDRSRQLARDWTERNRERLRALERARYAKNPAKFREKTRRYYRQNEEYARRYSSKHYYLSYQNEEVRKKAQLRTRIWARKNPEKARTNLRNVKAKRKNVSGSHTAQDVAMIHRAQQGKCACCHIPLKDKFHVDHIIPVSRGGTNERRNLQILCVACNLAKGARDPIDHMRSLGRLL